MAEEFREYGEFKEVGAGDAKEPKEFTYADAGVDIEKVKRSHARMAEIFKQTFSQRFEKFGRVVSDIGHYAGLIDIGGGKVLAIHVDGVGTKTLIAHAMRKYDTVGIDCVAMNVNDLICMGAEPVSLVDYIALEKADDAILAEIAKGLAKAAREAGVAIVGGETAIMPDVVKGFDLAAMSLGVAYKDRIVTGAKMAPGDIVIGLESSGLHSNGISLARKLLLGRFDIGTYVKELDCTPGEELLKPTRIYVKPVLEILQNCKVHGLAHITGGAFSKLVRIANKANVGFELKLPKTKPVFKLIQKFGLLSDREMYRTFNMGVGFVIVVPGEDPEDYERVADVLKKHKMPHAVIGEVTKVRKILVNGVDVG
jgi:phosphoribosylformylglycinamidine cyclo-ligase